MGALGGPLSGNPIIDWAGLSISLFDTILLVWLGISVYLNAEKHSPGIILVTEGLMTGTAFFIVHTVILAQGVLGLIHNYNFWWHIGWLPTILCPFVWYMVMLWYGGFWDDRQSPLYRRHVPWLALVSLFSMGLIVLVLFSEPLLSVGFIFSTSQTVRQGLGLAYVPFLILLYPLGIVVIILLSLDALFHPAPSTRLMGEVARGRARPWLIATTFLLLLVGLSVGATLFYLLQSLNTPDDYIEDLILKLTLQLSVIDILLAVVVTGAILCLGQAAAAYEIFTGKTFPRRGISGGWRGVILMAMVFSAVASFCIVYQVGIVYTVLVLLLMLAVFYAVITWRAMLDREKWMRDQRPFVNSQQLLDLVIEGEDSFKGELILQEPFNALCRDILAASRAAFLPLGALASLVNKPLFYPTDSRFNLPSSEMFYSSAPPIEPALPLDPLHSDGAMWALPLWNERGLNGALVLAGKCDGGFYTQEEIETARAGGIRLVDMLSTVELSHRLMVLQRQRLAQSQVLDRQTRRVLHDEVLPQLHSLLLSINSSEFDKEQAVEALSTTHRQISALLRQLPPPDIPNLGRGGLINALRHLLNHELAGRFDRVEWSFDPPDNESAGRLTPLQEEVLYFAARETLRNAARHARSEDPSRLLTVEIRLNIGEKWVLVIEDNGVGINPSGPTLEDGSGQGLALHSTMMAVVGGLLTIESISGKMTRVTMSLPLDRP